MTGDPMMGSGTQHEETRMIRGITVWVAPVDDLAGAKALYGKALGVEPYADQPYYVGFRVGDLEIGLDPHGHARGMTGPVAYLEVDDIRAYLAAFLGAGGREVQPITDVGGGKLIASVKDADGNAIALMQQP